GERQRGELETRLSELVAEREALAGRVRELEESLANLDATLRDADGECGALSGLLGLTADDNSSSSGAAVGGGGGGDHSVAGRLRHACCAVRELEEKLQASEGSRCAAAEEGERQRGELETRLSELVAEREALAGRVRELEEKLQASEGSRCAAAEEGERQRGELETRLSEL
ncbi:hypothetical protein DQ04_25641000, partial [Trypanosoma grayi]|uniref:hypothetical protein n=1 Tax=Trypanosoma grayi TaxID=71804 RepID=UPI0004F4963E